MSLKVEDILIKMIKSIDLFKWITDEEALELSKNFNLVFYQVGTLIIREDTTPNKIFLLKNWLLEVRKSKWLWTIVLWEIHPGEIFGEMSYLNQSKTMASVFAMQNSDVWEISSDKLWFFLDKYPHINNVFVDTMSKRQDQNKWKLSSIDWESDLDVLDVKIVI